jgi:hypothetical protein
LGYDYPVGVLAVWDGAMLNFAFWAFSEVQHA